MNTKKHSQLSKLLKHKFRPLYVLGCLLLCVTPFALTSSGIPSLLDRVINSGSLSIISSNGPLTYYEGPFGYTGFEYELTEAFADHLGVALKIRDRSTFNDMLVSIKANKGHFAANNLSITPERQQSLNFSVPYMQVKQHVIYRRGSERPQTIEDLLDLDIVVIANSSHAEFLRSLKETFPTLHWREIDEVEPLDLLENIHSGRADITIVDSTFYTVNRNIYPKARRAFDLHEEKNIAWAFPKSQDNSLYNAANEFLVEYRDNGELKKLREKYFANKRLDEGGALTFSKHIYQRLPKWEQYFKESAAEFDLDWLFIAAISYQESHWNARARSYTGVRGLMMLTQQTAKGLGIENRLDPEQSIYGGAKYFTQQVNRLPDRIKNPDRLWMALASYNVGYGHLEDARAITESQGGNPDLWSDVKKRLPLLSQKKYYKKTNHGYARGWEPVQYVERIRNYHEILIWHNESQQRRLALELQNSIEPVTVTGIFNDKSIN
jgi:membrane-bound lytic murein transglycosylase F